jgi:hypothetical protein
MTNRYKSVHPRFIVAVQHAHGRRRNLYSVFKDPFAQPAPRLIAQPALSSTLRLRPEGILPKGAGIPSK